MAKLTDEMKELIANHQAFIATASADGTPNIGPKRSTRVLDDEHLFFAEITGKKTYENLKQNPKVAVGVVDRDNSKGYRFVGTADVMESGPLYDKVKEGVLKMGFPGLKAAIKIHIDEIYNLGIPGAGSRID
ncbi:MAG: pyridoxamine 5'-phosphate oxidase family protein [Dehalococcoidia bacterium]|nr:pyridoxamine 5'-phosphate oxidase family protein [Dehalococcoidia bacterium]